MSQFEIDLVLKFLEGQGRAYPALRDQFKVSTVKSRQYTGAGFFLYFQLPVGVTPLQGNPSFTLADVSADIGGLEHGAVFSLWIKDGLLHMLEGATIDGQWPSEIYKYELSYIKVSKNKDFH